jgi:hypothetical protein
MPNKEVIDNNGNLSLQLYVKQIVIENGHKTENLISEIKDGQKQINNSIDNLFSQLKNIGIDA